MNKYNNLLLKVAHKYNIIKGIQETESDWKARLVYSICGMMAYASLWDESEEGTISIDHLKRKVGGTFVNYKSMYPELEQNMLYTPEDLEKEIANIFVSTGVVYHRPYQIISAMKHEKAFGNILFQRGISIDDISYVSGIGFYSKQNEVTNSDNIKTMFGLEQENLLDLWQEAVAVASWKSNISFEDHIEFLRLKPPFTKGYWVDKPDKTGIISILRTGGHESHLYYLYRYFNKSIEISPLPKWQMEKHNYRTLASACLFAYGTLPSIEYLEDGALVHLRMNYLLPPRELEFLKLYSWPETCVKFPCNFRRKLSVEVFSAIKNILSEGGYEFKGGLVDA